MDVRGDSQDREKADKLLGKGINKVGNLRVPTMSIEA
jgi:hypothetical protein